jgi:hypothetical protein
MHGLIDVPRPPRRDASYRARKEEKKRKGRRKKGEKHIKIFVEQGDTTIHLRM